MRIRAIRLSWFRGAADPVSLDLDGRSVVVYGANGSGKSSFVDAIEHAINNGRIGHLAHEYSGKRQERAIPNTHTPPGRKTEVAIRFNDDTELKLVIAKDGFTTTKGGESVAMHLWDYRQTVLRQDEVAAFIHETKGGKYSALLPLLGLHSMELGAENLRQLGKAIDTRARVKEKTVKLKEGDLKRKSTFGDDTEDEINDKVLRLYSKYCSGRDETEDVLLLCAKVKKAIEKQIADSSADQRRHVALTSVAEIDFKGAVEAVRSMNGKLADSVEPLIAERLEVLQAAGGYVERLTEETDVECPACGQVITVHAFQAHVTAEREHLNEIIETFDSRKAAIAMLCDSVKSLQSNLGKPEVEAWREEIADGPLAGSLAFLDGIDPEKLRGSCGEDELDGIEQMLIPVVDVAISQSKEAPADAQDLTNDSQTVEVARAVKEASEDASAVAHAESLRSFIRNVEQRIREEIRLRSQRVIDEISSDIQAMWATLHPDEPIDDVCLYIPNDTDKAIDIGLKFHGLKQESPRLTLSEGYRNSLGLSIFLAMAKREERRDRPLILDDVVVSLDRNHRGMIAELLVRHFAGRQVLVLTHDRDWYAELRQLLPGSQWRFRVLLPYETPSIGIRWSDRTTSFGDARAHLAARPDSAGNDARKIMDVEISLIAERLQVRLPYMRGERNDRRTAHDFLQRMISDSKRCFQRRGGEEYILYNDASEVLDLADRLLIGWANRASHTFDMVRTEATKLIDVCERALDLFNCPSCCKVLWYAEVKSSQSVQCQCGHIRWRYGKG
jgi:energy-coupling factor transporter ATP-binding protein EcfA2